MSGSPFWTSVFSRAKFRWRWHFVTLTVLMRLKKFVKRDILFKIK